MCQVNKLRKNNVGRKTRKHQSKQRMEKERVLETKSETKWTCVTASSSHQLLRAVELQPGRAPRERGKHWHADNKLKLFTTDGRKLGIATCGKCGQHLMLRTRPNTKLRSPDHDARNRNFCVLILHLRQMTVSACFFLTLLPRWKWSIDQTVAAAAATGQHLTSQQTR